MPGPLITKAGQEALDRFLSMRPPIIRDEFRVKILRMVSLLLNEQGDKEADRELVFEAMRLTFTKGYDPLFHMIEDPEKFKKLSIDPTKNINAYNAKPVQVKRWEHLAVRPTKRPDEMKVLSICASPRTRGNTAVLINESSRGAQEAGAKVEKIMLQKLKINPCLACAKCKQPGFTGFCAQKDDMPGVFEKIFASDAIILGFPIYSGRECAQLATFFDRWYCLEGRRQEQGRSALVIGTWGYPYVDTYDFVMHEIISVLNMFRINTVEAISACGFYGMLHGLDEKRKAIILRFPGELEKAYHAGNSLVTGQA